MKGLITLIDDDFIVGFEVFIKTLKKYTKGFELPFVVMDAGLSDEGRKIVRGHGCEIREIEKYRYETVPMHQTHDRLKKTYYTLDIFKQTDFSRLIFFDMDIVLLDSIQELIDWEMSDGCSIAACRAYNQRQDSLDHRINSGLLVIDRPAIGKNTYAEMMRRAKRRPRSMPDQTIINEVFGGAIDILPKRYNIEKRMQDTENYKHILKDPAGIHYVASKPWETNKPLREQKYKIMEKYWWDEKNDC